MYKKVGMINDSAYYNGKMGIIVASLQQKTTPGKESTLLYKLLINGKLSKWLPSECLEIFPTDDTDLLEYELSPERSPVSKYIGNSSFVYCLGTHNPG